MLLLAVVFIWISTPKAGTPDGLDACGNFFIEEGMCTRAVCASPSIWCVKPNRRSFTFTRDVDHLHLG
jgi:hypothetical protein